ncbi:hypothetical protein ANO14919_002090 [Xylariales sp. No.14919]|nr:hypothetical protein ANO14919_002090 [Xylariales sp. No.14919]
MPPLASLMARKTSGIEEPRDCQTARPNGFGAYNRSLFVTMNTTLKRSSELSRPIWNDETHFETLPEPESRRFAASGFDTAPPQPRLPFHASSVSLSYEARIVIDQGDSKQCVGLHNSMSLQNSRQFNGVEV